jgi:hypothetical protein
MSSLKIFDNFNDHFFDFDSDMDKFFKPIFPRSLIFDDSSDEETEHTHKNNRKARKQIVKKNPQLKASSFTQSYFSKTSLNNEGKPMTYTYQNQVEDHIKDGHEYRKRKEEINNNGNKRSIFEKQMDNKVHRIINSTNEKGENKQKTIFKGIKEDDLANFNKAFDEEFNQAFNWNNHLQIDDGNEKQQSEEKKKELPKKKSNNNLKQKKSNDKPKYSLRSSETNINQIGDFSENTL